MEKLLVLIGIVMILSACAPNKNKVEYQARIQDLNGTWNWLFDGLTKADIKRIREESLKDRSLDMKFSWGTGSFNPNGSWYFDIGEAEKWFAPDGGPLFKILAARKIGVSDIVIEIVSISLAKEFSGEELKKYSHRVIFSFVDIDRISYEDPDQILGIDVHKYDLYRLSGPRNGK